MEITWYYLRGKNREGPISQDEVQRLLDLGALTPDTLVWSESLSNWTSIRDISVFRLSSKAVPPPPPPNDLPYNKHTGSESPSLSTAVPRPWVRYWARNIDFMISALLLGFFWSIVDPASLQTSLQTGRADAAFALGGAFIWVFIEASLLSSWGTTPGKWLLNTSLRNVDGRKLCFSSALKRSFSVWWKGCGIGFPLAALFTCMVAYKKLMRTGITTWDRQGAYVVTHHQIGGLRTSVAVFFLLGVFLLAMLDKMSSQAP